MIKTYEVRVTRRIEKEDWMDMEIQASSEEEAIAEAKRQIAADGREIAGWTDIDKNDEGVYDEYECSGTIDDEENDE